MQRLAKRSNQWRRETVTFSSHGEHDNPRLLGFLAPGRLGEGDREGLHAAGPRHSEEPASQRPEEYAPVHIALRVAASSRRDGAGRPAGRLYTITVAPVRLGGVRSSAANPDPYWTDEHGRPTRRSYRLECPHGGQ